MGNGTIGKITPERLERINKNEKKYIEKKNLLDIKNIFFKFTTYLCDTTEIKANNYICEHPYLYFFIEPKPNSYYRIFGYNGKQRYNNIKNYLKEIGIKVKMSFDSKKATEILDRCLSNYIELCLFGGVHFHKYLVLNVYWNSINRESYSKMMTAFCRVSDKICAEIYNKMYIVTSPTLDHLLKYYYLPGMTLKEKKQLMDVINKKCYVNRILYMNDYIPFLTICKSQFMTYTNCFILNSFPKMQDQIVSPYLIHNNDNNFKSKYKNEIEYGYDNDSKRLIEQIIDDKEENLNILSSLLAAAKMNNFKKTPIVAVAVGPADSINSLNKFLNKILYPFDNIGDYIFYDIEKFNSASVYSAQFGNNILLFSSPNIMLNIEKIQNLISGDIVFSDPIVRKVKFKNTRPILIQTESEKTAKYIAFNLNAPIIHLRSDIYYNKYPYHEYSTFVSTSYKLTLDLLLYGLKQLSVVPTRDYSRNYLEKKITADFWSRYCSRKYSGAYGKSDIKNHFKQFVAAAYPDFTPAPKLIINKIRKEGYDDSKKIRLSKGTNPVAAFKHLAFDKEKFERDLKMGFVSQELRFSDEIQNSKTPMEKLMEISSFLWDYFKDPQTNDA